VEVKMPGMSVDKEVGEGYAGGITDAGYRTAKHFYAFNSYGDSSDREDVSNEGVKRDFFTLFPDGFEAIRDGGCEIFSDEG